jgi:hypothetical protein
MGKPGRDLLVVKVAAEKEIPPRYPWSGRTIFEFQSAVKKNFTLARDIFQRW